MSFEIKNGRQNIVCNHLTGIFINELYDKFLAATIPEKKQDILEGKRHTNC